MKPTYQIKDWDKHFENHESRKLKRTAWVSLPNRHDGKSFRRIADHPEGVAVFAAWTLILEVASKMPTRGILADEDGPLDADDLSSMTGFPASIFDAAFNLLTQEKFGWLTTGKSRARLPKSPAISRHLPQSPAVAGKNGVVQNRTEQKGMEGNGNGSNGSSVANATGASAASEPQEGFTIWKLAVGKLMSVGTDEQEARSFLGQQCKSYGKETVADAITKMLAQEPADPKTYLVAVLQGRNGTRRGNSKVDGSLEAGRSWVAKKEAEIEQQRNRT